MSGIPSAASSRASYAPTPAQTELVAALTRHVEAERHRRYLADNDDAEGESGLHHVPSYLRIPTEFPVHRMAGTLSPACSSPPSGETSSAVSPSLSPTNLEVPSPIVDLDANPFASSGDAKPSSDELDPLIAPLDTGIEPKKPGEVSEPATSAPRVAAIELSPLISEPASDPVTAQPQEERNEYPFPQIDLPLAPPDQREPPPPEESPTSSSSPPAAPSVAQGEDLAAPAQPSESFYKISPDRRERSRTPTPRGKPLTMPLRPLDQSMAGWGSHEMDRTPTAAPPRPDLSMTPSLPSPSASTTTATASEEESGAVKHGSNTTIRAKMGLGLTPASEGRKPGEHHRITTPRVHHVHSTRRRHKHLHHHKKPPSRGEPTVDVALTWAGGPRTSAGSATPCAAVGSAKAVYVTGTFADDWHAQIPLRMHASPSEDTNKSLPESWSTHVRLPPGTHRLKFIVDGRWRVSRVLPTAVDGEGNLVNYVEVDSPGSVTPNESRKRPPAFLSTTGVQDEQKRGPESQPEEQPHTEPPETTKDVITEEQPVKEDPSVTLPLTAPAVKSVPTQPYDWAPVATHSEADWAWSTEIPKAVEAAEEMEAQAEAEAEAAALAAGVPADSATAQATAVVARAADERGPPPLPRQLEKVILNAALGPGGGPETVRVDDNSVLPAPNHAVLHHLAASSIKRGVLSVSTTTRYRGKYVTTILYRPAEGS